MELADAVREWWSDPSAWPLLRDALDMLTNGELPSGAPARAASCILTELAHNARPAPTLHRGVTGDAAAGIRARIEGGATTITTPVRGWSANQRVADHFARGRSGLVLELAAGAAGLSIAPWSAHPVEAEWITTGRWDIVRYDGRTLWLAPSHP